MAENRRQLLMSPPGAGHLSLLREASAEATPVPEQGSAGAPELLAPVLAALEHIPSPAFVCDSAGRVGAANAAARRGFEQDEAFADRALASPDSQVSPLPVPGPKRYHLVVAPRPDPVQTAVERASRAWNLTAREVEVLARLAAGGSNGQIAGQFGLARRTVELHVTSLLRKAGAATRAQLIVALWQLSLPF